MNFHFAGKTRVILRFRGFAVIGVVRIFHPRKVGSRRFKISAGFLAHCIFYDQQGSLFTDHSAVSVVQDSPSGAGARSTSSAERPRRRRGLRRVVLELSIDVACYERKRAIEDYIPAANLAENVHLDASRVTERDG